MQPVVAWTVLMAVFLLAGEGLNLFRIHIEKWLAYGRLVDILICLLGLLLAFLGTAFLAGFVYFRDKKRGKLKREGWLGRRIEKPKRSSMKQTTDSVTHGDKRP